MAIYVRKTSRSVESVDSKKGFLRASIISLVSLKNVWLYLTYYYVLDQEKLIMFSE